MWGIIGYVMLWMLSCWSWKRFIQMIMVLIWWLKHCQEGSLKFVVRSPVWRLSPHSCEGEICWVAFKFPATPLLRYNLRVKPRQILKSLHICLHWHSPLLQGKELSFALMFSAVGEILFQKPFLEVFPILLLPTGLYLLLHSHPPILCICHQQKGGKGKLLGLSALDHPEDPPLSLVWLVESSPSTVLQQAASRPPSYGLRSPLPVHAT